MDFNPLPPQGGRLFALHIPPLPDRFQSTPSPRRETTIPATKIGKSWHFNPLPPQGGRPRLMRYCCSELKISIHSLPKEGDQTLLSPPLRLPQFQSTPSPRRETKTYTDVNVCIIHFNPLPPQGGRLDSSPYLSSSDYFNPLPPQGGRRNITQKIQRDGHFNPLPPQGGRHAEERSRSDPIQISIHSLPKEGDPINRRSNTTS